MKICPNCGAENEDNALTCILCEFELDEETEGLSDNFTHDEPDMTDDISGAANYYNNESVSERVTSSKGKEIIIALLALVILAASITGRVLLLKNKNNVSNENSDTVSESSISLNETTGAEKTTSQQSTETVTASKAEETTKADDTTTESNNAIKVFSASEISNYPQYIQAIKDCIDKGSFVPSNAEYALCDLNGDNIPEMILNTAFFGIYSISEGKYTELMTTYAATRSPSISLTDKGFIIINYLSPQGENSITYFKYEGGTQLHREDDTLKPEQYGTEISVEFTTVTSIAEISVEKEPLPTASVQVEAQYSSGNGTSLLLTVNGNYSYYTYEIYADCEGEHHVLRSSGTSYEKSYLYEDGSTVSNFVFYVTPYSDSGISGETVSVNYNGPHMLYKSEITPCQLYGQISAPNGSSINGYTTDYIVNDGAYSCVRTDLMNNWHVTAVNSINKNGTIWYELYDTDDGDYYGWLDSSHIIFY